jgi:hypothetical protein
MMSMRIDEKQIERILPEQFQRQIPFILSSTINETLFAARRNQIGDGNSPEGGVIDKYVKGGANRFTRRGMLVDKARKTSLAGSIYFQADRSYMRNTVYGAVVKPKKRRLIVPAPKMLRGELPGNTLTKYGGVKKGTVKKQDLKSYFVDAPRGYKGKGSGFGLWQRYGAKGKTRIRMILDLSQTSRQAEVTYPADKLIRKFVLDNIQDISVKAVKKALATAR